MMCATRQKEIWLALSYNQYSIVLASTCSTHEFTVYEPKSGVC